MNTPFGLGINTQQARELESRGFNIADLAEVGAFLDSVETLGLGSSFSTVASTLGRSRDAVARYRRIVQAIRNPSGGTNGQAAAA